MRAFFIGFKQLYFNCHSRDACCIAPYGLAFQAKGSFGVLPRCARESGNLLALAACQAMSIFSPIKHTGFYILV